MDERRSLLRLQLTPGLGRKGLRQLLRNVSELEELFEQDTSRLAEASGVRPDVLMRMLPPDAPEVERALRLLDGLGVELLRLGAEEYPERLATIEDPPPLLYLRGQLPQRGGVAIVGSRRAAHASLELAFEIARGLAEAGVPTVSGLARGVDGRAHEGSLEGGAPTVAVLGCGIDRVYPAEHAGLYRRMLEEGAIVTEVPPGTAPLAHNFPGRNRIISALSEAVLIVEAAEGSGSLITAEYALEQGRDLMAVPGAVHAPGSLGPNRLIKQGAALVTCADDVLEILGVASAPHVPLRPLLTELSEGLQDLLSHLDFDPLHLDEIAGKSGLTPMELSDSLLNLELLGLVQQLPGMRYVLKK